MDHKLHLFTQSLAIGIACCALAGTVAVLTKVAAAPGGAQRRDEITQGLRVLRASERNASRTEPANLPSHLCRGPLGAASKALRDRLAATFSRSGARLGTISIRTDPSSSRYPDTVPIEFSVQAIVKADGFSTLLSQMAAENPRIIFQAVELDPRARDLALVLKGEVVCWTGV